MTSESEAKTEAWIDKHDAKYAYAYDRSGKLKSWFGVSGIPHAILVDPNGTIIWRGHPSTLKGSTVEEALNGALKVPSWEWPDSARAVRKALAKRKYAAAISAAERMGPEGGEILDAVRSVVSGRVKGLLAAYEKGDILSVLDRGKACQKDMAKLPEADEVKALLAKIKGDKQALSVAKAQRSIRKIFESRKIKKKDFSRHRKTLEKIHRDFTGTFAGEQAAAGLVRLANLQTG